MIPQAGGVLHFPSSAREDAPEPEYIRAHLALAVSWHQGAAKGYQKVLAALSGRMERPASVRDARPNAVAATSFPAWQSLTRHHQARRTRECAYASGLMAAWADHPQAEQCVNCDLPFVPEIEDGWTRCRDHGMTCSSACTSEVCRVPSCREDDE